MLDPIFFEIKKAFSGLTLLGKGVQVTRGVNEEEIVSERELLNKKYEFSNHLGNVLTVTSDLKLGLDNYGSDGIVDAYNADVLSYSDYYPFGMSMPGRNYSADSYRYGFNGMEMDNEVSGNGNQYSTEFRQYDPRIARWTSLDPLMARFPHQSPFLSFNDNPIRYSDPTGLAGEVDKDGNAQANVYFVNDGTLSDEAFNQKVQEAMESIINGLQANGIGADQINWYTLNPNTSQGELNNLLSANPLNNVVEITGGEGRSFAVNNNFVSLFQSGGTQNTPFHEFLHLFGLEDRYHESRTMDGDGEICDKNNPTIPMRNLWTANGEELVTDVGYDWRTNAMSNGGVKLTDNQIRIMSDINTNEVTYKTALLINPVGIDNFGFNYGSRPSGRNHRLNPQAYSGDQPVSSAGYFNKNLPRNLPGRWGLMQMTKEHGAKNRRIINSLIQ